MSEPLKFWEETIQVRMFTELVDELEWVWGPYKTEKGYQWQAFLPYYYYTYV